MRRSPLDACKQVFAQMRVDLAAAIRDHPQ